MNKDKGSTKTSKNEVKMYSNNSSNNQSSISLSIVLVFFLFIFNPLESFAQRDQASETGLITGKLGYSTIQQPLKYVNKALFESSESMIPLPNSDTNVEEAFILLRIKRKYTAE
jgi:hypothetical protein